MNRYKDIDILKNENGKRYRSTVKYPMIDKKSNDIYIIGRQGDRLDSLAYKYYDNSRLWWIIARANNIGKGSLSIQYGLQLRIPQNQFDIIEKYKEINKVG